MKCSTILFTNFLCIKPTYLRGPLPLFLKYSAAMTTKETEDKSSSNYGNHSPRPV